MSTTTALNLLNLPLEIRELIWSHLINFIVQDANSSEHKQYHLSPMRAKSKSNRVLVVHDCYRRLGLYEQWCAQAVRFAQERVAPNPNRIPRRDDIRSLEENQKRHTKAQNMLFRGRQPIVNPILDYLLVNKQFEAELRATSLRAVHLHGRYLRVECCCKTSQAKIMSENEMVEASVFKVNFDCIRYIYH